MYDKLDLATV
ncbi:hypothetical protein MIMGU_mgv1a0095232mg, partial [Erythranthe guttata]